MTVRNVVFDLDGTLIDSSDGVVEAVNYSLRKMGEAEQRPEVIKAFIGYPLSQMYPQFTRAPVRELYRHFQQKAAETVVSSTDILPGVELTLHRLKATGFQLAIASTKIRRHIDGIVEKFCWHDLISAYSGGDEVEKVKPDPEILLLTLRRMGAMPAETIVVGDTVNDVLAARAVPMKVVGINSPYGGREKVIDAGPDYFIDSIEELVELLDNLKKEAV
ncbi:MAG: HAD family hydrolase [Candidatus Zixiibacteriota bacterium]|nr:MAG: HAD family hydrolase [candidate division Zixibacteria bacterium]